MRMGLCLSWKLNFMQLASILSLIWNWDIDMNEQSYAKMPKCYLTLSYAPIEFEYILKYLDRSRAGESQVYAARLGPWDKLL